VGVDSLKAGVDLPLFESQDPEFVANTVRSMKGLMVYSHSISIAGKCTVGGVPHGWDEVEPGSPKDPCQWEVFLKTAKEIGYDGYLSHEQCSPIIVEGHKVAGLDAVDERYRNALNFFKPMLRKLDYYTGHKD
jgi:hypothetical protein